MNIRPEPLQSRQNVCITAGLVGLFLLAGHLFPELRNHLPPCPFRALFHIPCPFCGVGQAAFLFADGRFIDAFRLNPFVALIYMYGTLQLFLGTFGAICGWTVKLRMTTPEKWATRLIMLLLLLGHWGYVLIEFGKR